MFVVLGGPLPRAEIMFSESTPPGTVCKGYKPIDFEADTDVAAPWDTSLLGLCNPTAGTREVTLRLKTEVARVVLLRGRGQGG